MKLCHMDGMGFLTCTECPFRTADTKQPCPDLKAKAEAVEAVGDAIDRLEERLKHARRAAACLED